MEQQKKYKYIAKENENKIVKTKMPNIKKIIMVASGKGGVGKSTVAAGSIVASTRRIFRGIIGCRYLWTLNSYAFQFRKCQ